MSGETMYDSVTAADIPPGAVVVAGYIDGEFAWSEEDWARFPNAAKVEIATTFTDAGDCLDIENGDATNEQAGAWVIAAQKRGVARPWLYTSRDNLVALQQAIAQSVGPGTELGYWVADWLGLPHPVPGADAVQFASPETGSGGHFDVSTIYGPLPGGPLPAPVPTPSPAPEPAPTPGGIDVQVQELQAGASGAEVKAVQSILDGKAHAGLAVDGSFGPKTEEAVKAWQTFFHIEVDGIVGAETWSTLVGG